MTTETKSAWAGASAGASSGFAEAARQAWNAFKRRREFRRAVAHMESMTDRELQDIGIERWQIPHAVYGGRNAVRKSATQG